MRAFISSLGLRCAAALFALSGVGCTSTNRGTTLRDAGQAFIQHDLGAARAIYEVVAARGPTRADRVEAERWLARLDWWFYAKPDQARARLLRVAAGGNGVAPLMGELAAMETRLGHYAEARAAARRALDAAEAPRERRNARLAHAGATVAEALSARLSQRALPDATLLEEARSGLADILASEPGVLEVSRPLLAVSLLTGHGADAWRAWQAYYHAASGGEVYNLVREPMAQVESMLPTWNARSASPPAAAALVRALSNSRFFPEAAALALDPSLDPSVRAGSSDIVAYAAFLQGVQAQADEYYRRTALGQGDRSALVRGFVLPLVKNWTALGIPGAPPAVGDLRRAGSRAQDAALRAVERAGALDYLRRQFGLDANFGTTAGYFDAHIGHRVVDETRKVEQYGRQAEVRFIVLDALVSNGFQSWAWCHTQEHGGWASGDVIWKVRSDDSRSGIEQWRRATDPAERRKWDEEIAASSAEDERRAAGDACASLPGLAGRLERADVDALGRELDRRGVRPDARLLAFVAELEQESLESNIFVHEGRHLIDRRAGIDEGAELEFRAKLAQLAFSRRPRTILARQVLSPILGDRTPHGQAQLRIAAGLVRWMKAHASGIAAFDSRRPILPQADLLTDEQLRAASRSMDPLAQTPR